MKKNTFKPRGRKKKNIESHDFDDLIFHDVLEHHDEELDNEDIIEDVDDIDLVEEALIDEKLEIPETIDEIIIDEKAPKKRGRKPVDKTKFYVDPKEFDDEIVKYYESNNMSNKLADMISKISHKLSFAPNFINYTYREEMVGDGVIRMMKALMAKKYNRDKGTNPFSYFTRIAFNAFRNRIKKEKHMLMTHEKYQEHLVMMSQNFNTVVKNNNMRITQDR